MTIREKFESRKNDNRYNTSYPLSPEDWKEYEVSGELKFDTSKPMSFYIHIPFCNSLCKFCEYTRTKTPDSSVINQYLSTLENDIDRFISKNGYIKLMGFDIGGGTPTSLGDSEFSRLLRIYSKTRKRCNIFDDDYFPSIESTFQSITRDKIDMIYNAGIRRISFGLQSSDEKLMKCLRRTSNRNSDLSNNQIVSYAKSKGIKVNIDIMYGLSQVNYRSILESVSRDMDKIRELDPDQVTLYEFRPNMSDHNVSLDKDKLYLYYYTFYYLLREAGYKSVFGRNTFSKNLYDWGMSSYLKSRMIFGTQYKGFGISAQSMSRHGVSYNIGKGSNDIDKLISNSKTYENDRYYKLPMSELLSKFIAISGYSGRIYTPAADKFTEYGDFLEEFEEEIDFLRREKLITVDYIRRTIDITEDGYKYYGAVFSLFYKR